MRFYGERLRNTSTLELVSLSLLLLFCVDGVHKADAESRLYRAQPGCPFNSPKDIPESITLDELNDACKLKDNKPDTPDKPESAVNVSPSGVATPAPTVLPPKPSPSKPDRRRFLAYDGRAIEGQDLRRIENTGLRTCVEACRGDQECKAISFDKWNNYCFLKRSISTGFRIEPKAIALVLSSLTPTLENRPTVIEEFRRRSFATSPYAKIKADNYIDCKISCSLDQRCEVFTYWQLRFECRLIEKPDAWHWNPVFHSGVKRQPPRD